MPRVGHDSYDRVGEKPPPALPQVWHVHHMEGDQWQAPGHRDVRQGGGAEAEAVEGGRGAEEHNGVLSGLQETFDGSIIV